MARRIACRCRSRPSSPSHAMSAAYSRSWLRSKQPPPSARHARPRGPKPSEPHGSGLQERICSSSCLSWLPPSQELEPPAIPGRFKSRYTPWLSWTERQILLTESDVEEWRGWVGLPNSGLYDALAFRLALGFNSNTLDFGF